ncbi:MULTISPECIES: beta-galactosidase family protein [unclassified Lactococcus]|uniref:glycoside hydrolase family 35 protein n=1 Tax=unclassified Lactococcus TaxID=2643510 RepID=UPI0011C7EC06|nr:MULTISPECIES: beta-galactosidase family protein [unclassified Lactococcus]MQW22528.1 beta-galactosidase [Lactococcus sp. dk101]TXK45552.1 beta-galactosidase [Lactococcus sp. dk310]TXK51402.1 beta-galactosidase [Lactococcus sp. dk322]
MEKKSRLIIKNNKFLLDGRDFQFISGAIHYFRMPKESWHHSLYNLKAMGANTVETYIPWNMHEKEEGLFNFDDNLDVTAFVKEAEKVGLFVIIRPTPYICAEWEFGGLPAWLLNYRNMRIRSSDTQFLEKVGSYYQRLFEKLSPLQSTHGGPILMMQLENEYGSFGDDKKYLHGILELMKKNGCEVPIFTSDGEWKAAQRAGNLTEFGVLPTVNFGSEVSSNLKKFTECYDSDYPLMIMEFWDGWFNHYGERIIKRDPKEFAESLREGLKIASVNLYMFHGGTNFGFMNGCSSPENRLIPQVTSYDYDAILDEAGNPTAKFYEIQKVIHELFPSIIQNRPLIKPTISAQAHLTNKVSFFEVKEMVSDVKISDYPMTMEELNHPYGYVMYEHSYKKDNSVEKFKIIDGSDRAQIFLNYELKKTQYLAEIGEPITAEISQENNTLSILMENIGRTNYGPGLLNEKQRKGIRTGVMADIHFMSGDWNHYSINDTKLSTADFSKPWKYKTPSLYKYHVQLEEIEDTYLDLTDFGKGFVMVNNINIGRFWESGPYLTLYIPKSYLCKGKNEIIIFETEGKFSEIINFSKVPLFVSNDKLISDKH